MKKNSSFRIALSGAMVLGFVLLALPALAQDAAAPAVAVAPADAAAPAAEPAEKKEIAEDGSDGGLTVITSDHLLYDYKNAFAVFSDNVVVIDPKLKLTADKLLVRFDDKGEVKFIEAKGQVFIEQDEVTARAEQATYDVAAGKIELTVNPLVQRGDAMLTGDRVIYYRNDGRLECFPNARLIIPSSEKGKLK